MSLRIARTASRVMATSGLTFDCSGWARITHGAFGHLPRCHAHLPGEFAHQHVKGVAHCVFSGLVARNSACHLRCINRRGRFDVKFALFLVIMLLPVSAVAQDRSFTLSAPAELHDTGLLQHILPRFSLKHGVRVTQVATGGEVAIGAEGVPVFMGLGTTWHVTHSDGPDAVLFAQWLLSDIGKRTIEGFQPDGQVRFSAQIVVEIATPDLALEGDPVEGEALSLRHCGRCHVVNETNRMGGMGQTPSFGLMRTFNDWQNRFGTFYVLNPHPSFSQIEGITPPFRANLPPAIFPLKITPEELESILAYVATIPPADLGAPLQTQ